MRPLESAIGGIVMRTSAERHRRAAEAAEEEHRFDLAAHEFFLASKAYRREGRIRKSGEMRVWERRALAQIILLADSALNFETQAFKLSAHAFEVSRKSTSDQEDPASELYALAAALYEEAANRYVALSERAKSSARRPGFLRKAATAVERAGANLMTATSGDSTLETGPEARELYDRASLLNKEADRLTDRSTSTEARQSRAPQRDNPALRRQLAMAWLHRLSRSHCQECERLWSAYSMLDKHKAPALKAVNGATGSIPRPPNFAAAGEWERSAMLALLDHEKKHHQTAARTVTAEKNRVMTCAP
jgi:hypothetical protein